MIEALVGHLWPLLAGAAAIVAAVAGAWLKGRRDAALEAELQRAREASAARGRADDAARDYRAGGGAGHRLQRGDF